MKLKLFFSLLLLFVIAFTGISAPAKRLSQEEKELERMVKKLRTKTGKVVVASPEGKVAGSVTITEAVKQVKAGNILRLVHGRYNLKGYHHWQSIEIEPDNVILEGDGTGKLTEVNITFWGQGCGVRDYWGHTVEGEGLQVVDSRIRPLIASSGKRTKTYFYNCLICPSYWYATTSYYSYGAEIFANNAEILFKKCTFVSVHRDRVTYTRWQVGGGLHSSGGLGPLISLGRMAKKGVIKFSECVIYTNGYLFRARYSRDENFQSLDVIFEDCIIYVGKGYFMTKTNTSDIKDLKKFMKVKTVGDDNVFKKAAFVKAPPVDSYRTDGRNFMLSAASDAKKRGIGADIGMNGLPMAPEEEEKKAKKK